MATDGEPSFRGRLKTLKLDVSSVNKLSIL